MSVNAISLIDVNREVSASQEALVPTEQAGTSIHAVLPRGLVQKTLGYLPPSADRSTALVCNLWNGVVQILLDPSLRVFGEEAWKNYFNFEVEGEVPPLPKEIYRNTRINRRRLAGENEAPPCTAILMPKGLTLNMLKKLMENPTNGNSTKFSPLAQRIVDELGDEPVEESYWFVITNDVIEGSRGMSYAEQKALVGQKTGSKCGLPTLLEAIACCVMHYVSSKKYLFGKDPWTFTRCQEQINGNPLVVGGFTSGGLNVNCYDFDNDSDGAAASWKFC